MKSKKTGTPTGSVEYSKGYKKRMQKKRRQEEKEWQSKNGPVIVIKRGEDQ